MVERNVRQTIVYADERVNVIYQCSICRQIFRDPVVAQCGVSELIKRYSLTFEFFSIHSVEIVFHHPVSWINLNSFE